MAPYDNNRFPNDQRNFINDRENDGQPDDDQEIEQLILNLPSTYLGADADDWLNVTGHQRFQDIFSAYKIEDLLNLKIADFDAMCGESHGRQIHEDLRRSPTEKLLCMKLHNEKICYPLFVSLPTYNHFLKKIADFLDLFPSSIDKITIEQPSGINIQLNDQFVANMEQYSIYRLEVIKEHQPGAMTTDEEKDEADKVEENTVEEEAQEPKIIVTLKV